MQQALSKFVQQAPAMSPSACRRAAVSLHDRVRRLKKCLARDGNKSFECSVGLVGFKSVCMDSCVQFLPLSKFVVCVSHSIFGSSEYKHHKTATYEQELGFGQWDVSTCQNNIILRCSTSTLPNLL